MLYALRHPVALVGLVLGFALAIVLRAFLQTLVARAVGDRSVTVRAALHPRRLFDPYGTTAAVLGGTGWGRPYEIPFRTSRLRGTLTLLTGPVIMVAAGYGVLTLGIHLLDVPSILVKADYYDLIRGLAHLGNAAQVIVFNAGMALVAAGILAIIPLPPLDGGRLLFLLAPRSDRWRRAEYALSDNNWGTLILLFLMVFPLLGRIPLGIQLITWLTGLVVGPLA